MVKKNEKMFDFEVYMLDRKKVIKEFENYVSDYDLKDVKIKLKVDHTYRVAKNCDVISESLGLNEWDKNLAWLSGMLHDIGRFEQLRRFHTFMDAKSVNHAELSADLLFKDGLIERFCTKDYFEDGILEKAIRVHNRLEVPEAYAEREKLFCDIIRDADKIDIIRVNCETPRSEIFDLPEEEFHRTTISDEVFEDVMKGGTVVRNHRKTAVDYIVGQIAFVNGLVFKGSFEELVRQGYFEELLNFKSELKETNERLEIIVARTRKLIETKIAGE